MRIVSLLFTIYFTLTAPLSVHGAQASTKITAAPPTSCTELLTDQRVAVPSQKESVLITDFLKNKTLADGNLQVTFHRSPDETIIEITPPAAEGAPSFVIASLIYRFDPASSTLHVTGMEVHIPKLRGQGLSRVLLALALREHPKTQRIQSELTLDNLEAIAHAFNKAGNERSAVLKTPAYKIRKSLGFSKIVTSEFRVSPNNDFFWYELVVERK